MKAHKTKALRKPEISRVKEKQLLTIHCQYVYLITNSKHSGHMAPEVLVRVPSDK